MLIKLRCRFQYPEFRSVSRAHQRVLLLNTPSKLKKFEKNYKEVVKRKKKSEIQPIFNGHPPYITEGNPSSDDFYPKGRNPSLLDWKLFRFPKLYKGEPKKFTRFYVSTENFEEYDIREKLILTDYRDEDGKRINTIDGKNLKDLEYEMRQNHYVKLGPPGKKKKFWFPTSADQLDAGIGAEKLYGYAVFDPLNPEEAIRQIDIPDEPHPQREELIKSRYNKRLNLNKELFIKFGISTHNIDVFHDFLRSQILDINNLYCLGHNEYGYTATYIFPISATTANPNVFNENEIAKFYKRDLYDIANDLDPNYRIYKPEILNKKNYKDTPIPANSEQNKNFLRNLNISLKIDNPVQEYYLMVVVQSDPELHKNDNPNCNKEGWFYRPEVYGRLITIVPKEFHNLPAPAQPWVARRAQTKRILP